MTYQEELEQIIFKKVLTPGEKMRYPFYGTVVTKDWAEHGFFALTASALLIATVPERKDGKPWIARFELDDISWTKCRRSLAPGQYIIEILFKDDRQCKVRAAKKLFFDSMPDQEKNFTKFMEIMSAYEK
ncbi:MAG: hypothetical protein IKM19_07160 [Firmicutes bacterium]|nr:hypothetical protein [Bacillota bacterium]MBR3706733.1 hypothetical protein [Bacillota bacterium]MBR6584758.1 hypothetical protein [Bacillota bacterium]